MDVLDGALSASTHRVVSFTAVSSVPPRRNRPSKGWPVARAKENFPPGCTPGSGAPALLDVGWSGSGKGSAHSHLPSTTLLLSVSRADLCRDASAASFAHTPECALRALRTRQRKPQASNIRRLTVVQSYCCVDVPNRWSSFAVERLRPLGPTVLRRTAENRLETFGFVCVPHDQRILYGARASPGPCVVLCCVCGGGPRPQGKRLRCGRKEDRVPSVRCEWPVLVVWSTETTTDARAATRPCRSMCS